MPSDYPTIQSAFDVLSDGDTVLVELGEYAEALIAPPLHFSLLGNTETDTGDFPRPTIDASLLPDTMRGACLALPEESSVIVEKMRFRNRFGLSPAQAPGGVLFQADSATFRYCAFDSLYGGIWKPSSERGILIVENCVFREDSVYGIHMERGTLLATHCLFDGGWGWAGAVCGINSIINQCTFRNRSQYLLTANGEDIMISDCVFGPSEHLGFSPVELVHFSGKLQNCVFSDIHPGPNVLFVESEGLDTIEIIGNIFTGNSVTTATGTSAVVFQGTCNPDFTIQFENNTILACTTASVVKGLSVETCVTVSNNRIVLNEPQDKCAALVFSNHSDNTFNRNIFSGNGFGLRNFSSPVTDARDNWWGDSTGPRATTNPFGQGDSVSDNILYDPWTTDTLNWISTIDDEMPVIPKTFEISVFPNPFNSNATLLLRVPEPTVLRVELFDIMGRRIKEIFSGAVAIEKKVSFNAAELSSGVYFARAADVYFHRKLVSTKLLLIR